MGLSQEYRELKITTPLGADVLAIERVSGSVALGRPFEFVATAVAENDEFSFDDLMGEAVTVALELSGGEKSYFNGLVTQIQHSGYTAQGHSSYDLTLAPWLWFLTQASNCRIFQNKTVPEIIEFVFREYSVADFSLNLTGSYPARDYCVQYRETDFNFVQRLMEHEGIYYYWEHDDGSHKMIVCDAMSAHDPIPGAEELVYRSEQSGVKVEDYLSSWKVRQKITSASYALNSFNFEAPSPATNTKLLSLDDRPHKHSQGEHKLYDFPGDFVDQGEGARLASIRREEIQCETKTIVARSNARALAPGYLVTPLEVPRDDQSGKPFLITAMSFQATAGNYGSGAGSGEEPYVCSFTAIPSEDCVFRPARSARIPRMQGLQTAMVTGPSGEEIFVDKYGRVKVQFHWDREGKYDDCTSCWIRVAQVWGGGGWGGMAIPRIGHEVIVDFLEGNPDQPIITGRVYNEDNKVPYDLPGDKTKTTIKSNSSKGGGGSNELRFEDLKGSEEVYVHAQKDKNEVVENDKTVTVHHDSTETVDNDKKITVTGKHTEEITKDTAITVTEGKLIHKVNTGTADYTVKGAVTETYQDTQTTTVSKEIKVTSSTKFIEMTAAERIKLVTGSSSIELFKNGDIKISGVNITVVGDKTVKQSSDDFKITGLKKATMGVGNQSATFDLTKTSFAGAAITSSAVGMHQLTGAIIKIN